MKIAYYLTSNGETLWFRTKEERDEQMTSQDFVGLELFYDEDYEKIEFYENE